MMIAVQEAFVDDISSLKICSAKDEILALARAHGVAYEPTALDRFGSAITRLAGDDVQLDEPAGLLLALRRAGHISKAEAARLHGEYLRAKYE
jgi:hypothetical protein